MRNFLRKLFDFFSFLKVASMCLAALYLIFWFYRFFNLPLTDFLYPIFDIFIMPLKKYIETIQIYNGAVIEMGYFAMGVFLVVCAFIFSRIEIVVLELDRQNELREIAKKRKAEKQMNMELQREHTNSIMEYKYFSVYITYKLDWASELVAQRTESSLLQFTDKSYLNTVSLIKQYLPSAETDKYGASVFIRAIDFDNFDSSIDSILEAIKIIKKQNASQNIKTDFMIICDAQSNLASSQKSYEILVKMAGMDYLNKAIVTSRFKTRFDLISQQSKYTTETIGIASLDKNTSDFEFYCLKSKPRSI